MYVDPTFFRLIFASGFLIGFQSLKKDSSAAWISCVKYKAYYAAAAAAELTDAKSKSFLILKSAEADFSL